MQILKFSSFSALLLCLCMICLESLKYNDMSSMHMMDEPSRLEIHKASITPKSKIFINANKKRNIVMINRFNSQKGNKFTMKANQFIGLSKA